MSSAVLVFVIFLRLFEHCKCVAARKQNSNFLSSIGNDIRSNYGNNTEDIPVMIGIYSICLSSSFDSQHIHGHKEFVKEALSVYYGTVYGFYENNLNDSIAYQVYDVCQNQTNIAMLAGNLMLDEHYRTKTNRSNSNILCILTYVPEELLKLLMEIISPVKIPIVSFNSNISVSDQYKKLYPFFFEYGVIQNRTDAGHYIQLATSYGSAAVLDLNKDTEEIHDLYQKIVKVLKNEICLVYETVQRNRCQIISTALSKDASVQVVLLLGEPSRVAQFLQTATKFAQTIILIYETDGKRKKILEDLRKFLRAHPKYLTDQSDVYTQQVTYTHIFVEFSVAFYQLKTLLDSTHRKYPPIAEVVNALKPENNIKPQVHGTNCSKITCKGGFEKRLVRKQDIFWKNIYRFECLKCKKNYIKNSSGNECERCRGRTSSNHNNTACILNYSQKQENIFGSTKLIATTLLEALTIFLGSILTILLHRPKIRFNFVLIQLQILLSILLATFLLIMTSLWQHSATAVICATKKVLAGMCFMFYVAVSIVNLHVETHRHVVVALMMGANSFILIAYFNISPPKTMEYFDAKSLTRSQLCSTFPLFVQVLLTTTLWLINLLYTFHFSKKICHKAIGVLFSTLLFCAYVALLMPMILFMDSGNHANDEEICNLALTLVNLLLLTSHCTVYVFQSRLTQQHYKMLAFDVKANLSCNNNDQLSEDKKLYREQTNHALYISTTNL